MRSKICKTYSLHMLIFDNKISPLFNLICVSCGSIVVFYVILPLVMWKLHNFFLLNLNHFLVLVSKTHPGFSWYKLLPSPIYLVLGTIPSMDGWTDRLKWILRTAWKLMECYAIPWWVWRAAIYSECLFQFRYLLVGETSQVRRFWWAGNGSDST